MNKHKTVRMKESKTRISQFKNYAKNLSVALDKICFRQRRKYITTETFTLQSSVNMFASKSSFSKTKFRSDGGKMVTIINKKHSKLAN